MPLSTTQSFLQQSFLSSQIRNPSNSLTFLHNPLIMNNLKPFNLFTYQKIDLQCSLTVLTCLPEIKSFVLHLKAQRAFFLTTQVSLYSGDTWNRTTTSSFSDLRSDHLSYISIAHISIRRIVVTPTYTNRFISQDLSKHTNNMIKFK